MNELVRPVQDEKIQAGSAVLCRSLLGASAAQSRTLLQALMKEKPVDEPADKRTVDKIIA